VRRWNEFGVKDQVNSPHVVHKLFAEQVEIARSGGFTVELRTRFAPQAKAVWRNMTLGRRRSPVRTATTPQAIMTEY
jgi:hypothetical protein